MVRTPRHRSFCLVGALLALLVLLAASCAETAAPVAPPACPPSLATPTVPADAEVALAEDFRATSALTVGAVSGAHAALVDDAYRLTVAQPDTLAWSALAGSYGTVTVQVDTALVAGPPTTASGLALRMQQAEHWYLFSVAFNGFYRLERWQAGRAETLLDWTPAPTITRAPAQPHQPPPVNRLRAELDGSQMRLFVNGALLEATTDDALHQGAVALTVQSFAAGTTSVCFDNLLILTYDDT